MPPTARGVKRCSWESARSRYGEIDAAGHAQDTDRRANDQRAELTPSAASRARAGRSPGPRRASGSQDADLARQLDHVEDGVRELLRTATEREEEADRLRQALAQAETDLVGARASVVGSVEQAQAQARLQVAADRERRLDEESSGAAVRLAGLRRRTSVIDESDRALAAQMSEWHADLGTRVGTLTDAERHLSQAEQEVHQCDSLTDAEHGLDAARCRA
ncbi:MAG: hypothetical protein U0132_09570 [Gemmatimonadaceae bacterium]